MVVAVVFTVQAAAALSLPIVGAGRIGAALAVVGFGIGFGVASLVKPALLADRYGTTAYATIAGILATPPSPSPRPSHPSARPSLYAAVGYPPVLAVIGAACLVAAVGIVARATSPTPVPADQLTGAAVLAGSSAAGTDSAYISKP
nr:hypothetical protein GCM10020092_094410 [Actinoplanes digitatis]